MVTKNTAKTKPMPENAQPICMYNNVYKYIYRPEWKNLIIAPHGIILVKFSKIIVSEEIAILYFYLSLFCD